MKISLSNDLSKLTTIESSAINKLFNKTIWCISSAVNEARLANDNIVEIDVGYGLIVIKIEEDNVRYRFIPNDNLCKVVQNTLVEERSLLDNNIEKSLVNKFTKIYKEMF